MSRFFSIFFVFLLYFAITDQIAASAANVVSRMNGLGAFRAQLTIVQTGSTLRGTLSYEGGKMHLALADGRVIASNGREMIVYNPATRVAGRQPVAGGGGLGWLLSGFTETVASNHSHLVATDPSAGVQEVRLFWNEGYTLRQLRIRHRDSDQWMNITLSNIQTVTGFSPGLFTYRPPAGSRTVENPLNPRN